MHNNLSAHKARQELMSLHNCWLGRTGKQCSTLPQKDGKPMAAAFPDHQRSTLTTELWSLAHMCAQTHAHMYTHTHTHTHTHAHTHIHIHKHTHTYSHKHKHIQTNTHTHTHTHTPLSLSLSLCLCLSLSLSHTHTHCFSHLLWGNSEGFHPDINFMTAINKWHHKHYACEKEHTHKKHKKIKCSYFISSDIHSSYTTT